MKNYLKRIAVNAPKKPGVYIMKDQSSKILYVGKSINLNARLASYFGGERKNDPKTLALLQKVEQLEYIITDTEQEAFLLECQLIKKNKPWYNVRLKDDKNYPYIKIDIREKYPLVYITRKIINDGAAYYGPYANAASVRKTLNLLKRLFPYRSCTKKITGKDERACLDFHINRCIAPCIGYSTEVEYAEVIEQVKMFLDGKREKVLLSLARNMSVAASSLEFEKAAKLSQTVNIDWLEKPLNQVVVYLDPIEFKSTWLGNKAIYRTRMAISDNGELIIVAPGLKEFGEDPEIDYLIRKYGYSGTETTLQQVLENEDLQANLSAAAHLIHGTSDGRFRVTYATSELSREEIESVGYEWADVNQVMSKFNIEQLTGGFNNELFFISNPAQGLWIAKGS